MSEKLDEYPPLPAPTEEFRMASPEQFMHLQPDSFKPLPGSDVFVVRETDIARLSGGAVGAKVFRAGSAKVHSTPWHWHEWEYQIGYVVKGWALYDFEGIGQFKVEAGTFLFQLPNNRHREVDSSSDFEAIEITFPANIKNIAMVPNEQGQWENFAFGTEPETAE